MANNYTDNPKETGEFLITKKSTETGGTHTPHSNVDTITVPSTIVHGQKTIATNGTEEALGSSTALTIGVNVKALAANTNPVFVGDSSLAVGTGYELSAGESVFISIDNIATVFVDVTTNDEGVSFIGN